MTDLALSVALAASLVGWVALLVGRHYAAGSLAAMVGADQRERLTRPQAAPVSDHERSVRAERAAAAREREQARDARTARLLELAQYIPAGPWRAGRSDFDMSLMLYGADGEPLALVYGGSDLAHYLELCAPAVLLAADAP